MRAVKVTLGAGVALIAVVGALTLTRSPPRVVRAGSRATRQAATLTGSAEFCQANETLPAGVTAIRLSIETFFGSPVEVEALSGSRVLTKGRRNADWTGGSVTVPVTPVSHSASHAKICAHVGPDSELIALLATPTGERESAVLRSRALTGNSAARIGGRMDIEYLAAGQGSWWSRILEVARHMGIGHALSGTWVALLIAALMAAVGALAIRVTLREQP